MGADRISGLHWAWLEASKAYLMDSTVLHCLTALLPIIFNILIPTYAWGGPIKRPNLSHFRVAISTKFLRYFLHFQQWLFYRLGWLRHALGMLSAFVFCTCFAACLFVILLGDWVSTLICAISTNRRFFFRLEWMDVLIISGFHMGKNHCCKGTKGQAETKRVQMSGIR